MQTAGPVAEVVVGAADPAEAAGFLAGLGLVDVEEVALDAAAAAALLGRPGGAGTARRLASPHVPGRSTVLVVPAASAAGASGPWDRGPRALDLYSADLDASTAALAAAGHGVSPEAVVEAGPMRMRQVMVRGPEGLAVVLVDSTHRRSSACDLPAAPLHSEPHSVVWCVADHGAEVDRWVAAGWTAGPTIGFAEPTISDELGLPERPTPITMTMLSDPDVSSVRVELLTFDDHRSGGGGAAPTALASLVARVGRLDDAVARWGAGASFGPVVGLDGGARARAGTTAGGVRLVLVEG